MLLLMVAPQLVWSTFIKQQTPNPLAQFPAATPPLSVHSVVVKQVPKVLSLILVVHSSLSNWTTLNNENDFFFSEFNSSFATECSMIQKKQISSKALIFKPVEK